MEQGGLESGRYNCCLESNCAHFLMTCARCQQVRDAFATDGETRVWNKAVRRRSKCTSSLAASAQKFKDRKSRGWERQSPTLPVCPSANHTLGTFPLMVSVGYGHYMMKAFGTLLAFCQERFLEQRRKPKT